MGRKRKGKARRLLAGTYGWPTLGGHLSWELIMEVYFEPSEGTEPNGSIPQVGTGGGRSRDAELRQPEFNFDVSRETTAPEAPETQEAYDYIQDEDVPMTDEEWEEWLSGVDDVGEGSTGSQQQTSSALKTTANFIKTSLESSSLPVPDSPSKRYTTLPRISQSNPTSQPSPERRLKRRRWRT